MLYNAIVYFSLRIFLKNKVPESLNIFLIATFQFRETIFH